MAQNKEISRYQVALTVFVIAEGLDERDAQHVARQAVAEALDTPDGVLVLAAARPRAVEVTSVMPIAAAFTAGHLTVQPNTTSRH
ncbi:hypothetical protein [Kutzneria kofuensis]|uniref:Uncharacterized protein n=1 Tax=Kutzneria kofuensis TaxID=103725 RepID=A0A7W9KHB7_9PSEU|nr:hypothetical protein [Kutzneria kofuensis]MBB5892621.1 hypothetical protein [Kutzneria kofuensis]